MKLHIITDLHNEFGRFVPPETDAEVVILAGDIDLGVKGITWAQEAFAGKPVLYVPGNHEYYGEVYQRLREKMREAAAGSNVHLLDCGRYEQDGVVFLGATLWTNFKLFSDQRVAMVTAQRAMADFMRILFRSTSRFGWRDGVCPAVTPEQTKQWHTQEISWLKKKIKISWQPKNRGDHPSSAVTALCRRTLSSRPIERGFRVRFGQGDHPVRSNPLGSRSHSYPVRLHAWLHSGAVQPEGI